MKFLIEVAIATISLAVIEFFFFARSGIGQGMGPAMGSRGGMGMMAGASIRRNFVMRNGIDPKYAGLSNPLPSTAHNISRGRQLYDQNCASCHGARGLGDGPAAKNLRPPPASLTGLRRMQMVSDGYLDWTIDEGGTPVGSAMPPFKDALKPDDIWRVILFIQKL